MDKALNDLVNDALFQWVALTGANATKRSYSITNNPFNEYELKLSIDHLNESRELDETGLTTWMMLRGYTEGYMKNEEFTAYDLIFNNGPIKNKLAAMHSLHAALEDPLVIGLIDTFIEKIRTTAKRYNFAHMDELEELLADKHDLAWVRRDALLSLGQLNVHQFTQGKSDPLPIQLNSNIYEIWNVNSLVRALRSQGIPGITTVLVRDPEAMHSFFVFAIKNGDNITVLTDKSEDAHPASKRMSRRPDRELERRAQKHWFPYQLLELKATEDGRHLYAEARTALVPINVEAVKLSTVGQLGPHQFVWLMLISELILDKFWKQNYHAPELSYTGEMVVEPHGLVGETSALVKSGLYQPLLLEPLTRQDVTSEATAPQWETKPTYFYEWMVERYKDQVPEDIFNVVGEKDVRLIEQTHGIERKSTWGEYSQTLEYLDPQNFGPKDKIVKDRAWAGRKNQMSIVQKLANAEYRATKDELRDWYKKQIMKRAEFFANAAARGELIGPKANKVVKGDGTGPFESAAWSDKFEIEQANLLSVQLQHNTYGGKGLSSYAFFSHDYNADISLGAYTTYNGGGYECYDIPEVKANVMSMFVPNCPEALAFFLDMPVDKLPWQMQHWYDKNIEPYSGNSILDRLDPVDWALENPWMESFKFRVGVPFSKRAFNARRKALGLPRYVVPEDIKW